MTVQTTVSAIGISIVAFWQGTILIISNLAQSGVLEAQIYMLGGIAMVGIGLWNALKTRGRKVIR